VPEHLKLDKLKVESLCFHLDSEGQELSPACTSKDRKDSKYSVIEKSGMSTDIHVSDYNCKSRKDGKDHIVKNV
jgi:hypothetical protein